MHEAMRVQRAASRWRVLPVVLGSTLTFFALAILVYWLYFGYLTVDNGLVKFQVLFYLLFMVHLLGSFGAAAALTIWTRAPIYPTIAAVVVTFTILIFLLVAILMAENACTHFVSFPSPGYCDD